MNLPIPSHGKRFVINSVALTMSNGSPYEDEVAISAGNQIESVLKDTGYYDRTPFTWITFVIRNGLKYDELPEYGRISRKYGDLAVSIEIDVRDLERATKDEVKVILGTAALKSLIHAGKKYGAPTEKLEQMLDNLPDSL